jgi:hypothetical protein
MTEMEWLKYVFVEMAHQKPVNIQLSPPELVREYSLTSPQKGFDWT